MIGKLEPVAGGSGQWAVATARQAAVEELIILILISW
jgi:hypothetical protein